jgi:hypothetical protein
MGAVPLRLIPSPGVSGRADDPRDRVAGPKGEAAPEVERLYTHAYELCERVGEPLQLFRVLWGLWMVYSNGGEYQPMLHVEELLLSLAQRLGDPDLLGRAGDRVGPWCAPSQRWNR